MIKIKRTTGEDPDFIRLTAQLDAYYRELFGSAMDYFEQFNKISTIKHAVVIYEDDIAVACGSFREFNENTVEIKRMYVLPDFRKRGFASKILAELEEWAKEIGYRFSVIETSISLLAAIDLYQKRGYEITENWGQYIGVQTSRCMKKAL